MSYITDLQAKGLVKIKNIKGVDSFVLTGSKSMLIPLFIQEQIKNRYPDNSEIGGVLSMKFLEGENMVCTKVYFFDNTQTDKSKYSPDYNQFHKAIAAIFKANELPFFFHTHPTKLGIKSYDYQAANFYLTSSLQDRDASFSPIQYGGSPLVMPNIIFVSDKRFEGGLGIGVYGGNIFPLSFNRLGSAEIVALEVLAVVVFVYLLAKNLKPLKWIVGVLGVVIAYYFYCKPKYNHLSNGDILISV